MDTIELQGKLMFLLNLADGSRGSVTSQLCDGTEQTEEELYHYKDDLDSVLWDKVCCTITKERRSWCQVTGDLSLCDYGNVKITIEFEEQE